MAAILVVDDDASARDLLTTVLGYAHHEIREAHNGAEALAALSDWTPALIIVDLLMPRMNGMEFVRRLREYPQLAAIPVIFYSASYLQAEAQNLARVCGVSHLITKPAEPEQIFAAVNAALGEKDAPLPKPAPEHAQHEYLSRLTAALSQKAAHVVPRLEAMISLGLRLASERDPLRLLADFCDASRKIIGAKFAAVSIRHDGDDSLRYQFSSGMPPEVAAQLGPTLWQAPIYQAALATGRPRRLAELCGDPEIVGLPADHPPVHSLLCVPVQSPQKTYGLLALFENSNEAEFSQEEEALAQILAAQVGRIYENGSLYREVKQYAQRLEAEIVERKQAQEEIRALNSDLERRIAERTTQLTEANAELEAFGYTVSHDLRAPLRALSGYTSMMLEMEGAHLTETGRHYLQGNLDSAHRMSRMVDDLLKFSHLGRQSLTLESIDVNAMIEEVWGELRQQDSTPAQFDCPTLPLATADRGMLRQVWTNLISNALKYSSKNPQRAIVISGQADAAGVQYCIRDNGVGFNKAYADRLFKVFERLHSPQDFDGTGAGLAIVDRIVRRHGGRVWADSELGAGATFCFTLPQATNPS